MTPFMTRIAAATAALLGGLLVAGCGGGATADTTPKVAINSVKVFGDSLQDSGTFGYKFTVQSASNAIYVERVAAGYGQKLCNFFTFTGTTFAVNTAQTGCTNFSIGGGRITYSGAGGAANPLNVGTQMATYAAAGSYTASDLVIVDGGGNDSADLVGAYLAIQKDSGASFVALLGTLQMQAQAGAALQSGDPAKIAQAAGAYMTALADKFYGQIKASVLDKGATHVVVMNIPDITLTPRFQMVLDSIAAAYGGGSAGATARAQSQALFQGWMTAFNTELAAKVAGNDSVALIDFFKGFQDQYAAPAQFGLINVKTPACPITGVGSDGLPTYSFPTCNDSTAAAGWQSYAFSDSFHPTPYGHQLTQQLIAKSLATKGWL